jgi:parallel beta-helix repeat protein
MFKAPVVSWLKLFLTITLTISLLVTDVPVAKADTEVGGPIISDTTWTLTNSPYIVIANVEVWEGVTLTIEPGVTVKFDSEKNLQVNGELIAQGTAGNLITFTSNQPDPAPGDWGNIEFTSTAITTTMDAEGNYISGSVLQYCVVEYAGTDGYTGSAIDTHSLLIDHCTIRNNGARGISNTGTETSPSRITNNTVSDNQGKFGGGIDAWHSTVSGNIVSGNSVGECGGGIDAVYSTVSGNVVSSNSARVHGGGIDAWHSTVSGNTVSGNSADYDGGGIHARDITVSGNTVSGNSADYDGGGIYARDSTVLSNTITANVVSGYSAQGAGAYVYGSSDFLYNTIVGNSGPSWSTVGGVEIEGTPQVHYNNFYGNEPYDIAVVSSDDISGTHNYWGTVSSVDILEQVYDWYDDSSRGKFLYVPYLQDPSPDAPFPPPIGLTADFQDSSVILSWDAHPSFTTGWGYKVYYDTDSSLPPYEGTGLNEGDSPIDVGDDTSYTLTGLDPSQDYYFAVTAYDNEGHESWYSNLVQKQGGYWVYLPVVLRQ